MSTVVETGYDYSALPSTVARKVRASAGRIKKRLKRSVQDIIEIGKDLIDAKGRLKHGQWGEWLDAEFEWRESTALNFMRVAENFKSTIIADLPIKPTALYLLAQPSTSDEARSDAIMLAESGETITVAKAKELIVENRQPPSNAPWEITEAANRLREMVLKIRDKYPDAGVRELPEHLRSIAAEIELRLEKGDGY